jgi:ABC-2 type transport system ATP-binding protein
MIIRTQHLSQRFGRTEALHELTVNVPEGAVFALVGPNGAGKTTAIKTLMNIIRPASGRAEVLGVDSRRLRDREFAQIGYVSENQRLPAWMRVGYFLSYCKAFYSGWRDDDLEALIRSYQLPLDRKIGELSRGMRVKAALASSLAYRPRLIVLDEPFSGLDVLVRDQLIESVLERTPESTVFLASHDLAEIESFATHIGYLDSGRLRFVEETGTLSHRFREIELTLPSPAEVPRDWPRQWLNPEQSGAVMRFTDSRFEPGRAEEKIRQLFPDVREIAAHNMTLRQIFIALAKSPDDAKVED